MAFYHENSSKNSIVLGGMGKGRAFYLKKELFNKYFYKGNLMVGMNDEGIVSLKKSEGQNVLIVGKTGIGKTSTYNVPNILVEEEKSFIVLDPHKELYQETFEEKLRQGYNIEIKSIDEYKEEIVDHLVKSLLDQKTVLYVSGHSFHYNASWERNLNNLIKQLYEHRRVSKKECNGVHVLLEEANGYKLTGIQNFLKTCNSYQIQFSLVVHTVDCLNRLYGKETAKSMLGSFQTKLLMGTESMKDAEYFSDLTGGEMSPKEILYMPYEKSLLICGSTSQIIYKLPPISRFE
ncbi:type IV secretory system conjugative DNA transfer family protein [Priestia megaterium]|uniref:type IV secretory system conjugative DNA transfer family protein n=1 Tax=Priestia megaterium TaxID=1404 RepID=UPI003179A56E